MIIRFCYVIALVTLVTAGCSTMDVNPPAPRVNTGYVDFYTKPDLDLWWEVKGPNAKAEMQTLYREYKALPESILRLEAPPGTQRFQVWFSNLATEGPITVSVVIEDGKITPVRMTLTGASSTSALSKEYRFGGSAKGYARGTKVVSEQTEVFKIGAQPGTPQAYQPKKQMPYFSARSK